MGNAVRVESIDSLKHLRIALIKFAEIAGTALINAESEMRQMLNWLENEQLNHWQTQIRKRHDQAQRAKEAVRMKKIFKDSTGRTQSAVDEEKALNIAQARLQEAEQKFANTKKYARVLQKEIDAYKGHAQRFATTIQSDIPQAATMLEGFVHSLEAYISLSPVEGLGSAPVSVSPTAVEPPPTVPGSGE